MPFHTRSSGPNLKALLLGFKKASELAKQTDLDVIYLTPAFDNVANNQTSEILGKKTTDRFIKNREITIDGVKFHLETKLKKNFSGPAIFFAVHVSLDQLAEMMADNRTKDFVYVVWSDKELLEYEANNPTSKPIYQSDDIV